MIEVWVNDAWSPVVDVSQITSRSNVPDADLFYGVICRQTCEVEHPVLGLVSIHQRMFAWRSRA